LVAGAGFRVQAAAVLRPSTKAADASALLARSVTPEAMRPGWAEALRMSRSALPHRRLLSIDERLEHAAARPVIVPETIVCDHGSVFVSHAFRSSCRYLGINLQPAHKATPTDKGTIEKTLGFKGAANGGVYQFSIPRAESISEGGMTVPPALGTAIAINFQPTGGGKAAITGDFVLLGSEVNPIVKALRHHGIEVTALHSHMIDDSPHLFFMHFWANDEAQKLAQGLRAALDLANVKRGG